MFGGNCPPINSPYVGASSHESRDKTIVTAQAQVDSSPYPSAEGNKPELLLLWKSPEITVGFISTSGSH